MMPLLKKSFSQSIFSTLNEKISDCIDWARIESILMSHYTVGTSAEGADAYLQLLLFKCLILQKRFRINSDPALENQINERLSFKKFLQLPLDKQSPNHFTFSRFRTREHQNTPEGKPDKNGICRYRRSSKIFKAFKR
jgi:IS5 family transposase